MDYYFSIMGHGDALISASIINKSPRKFIFICDRTSESIVKFFFPDLEIRSFNLRPIYDFKKSNIFNIFRSFFWVFWFIKSLNSNDRIFFDKHDIRAVLFSYLTKAKYIKNCFNEENIYFDRLKYITSFSSSFEYFSLNFYIPHMSKIGYFPISRVFSKNINYSIYSRIENFMNVFSSRQLVYKHFLDFEYSNKYNFNNYNDINELVSIINETDLLIVCDSLVLHIAYIMKKPFWVVFNDNINYKWLPPGTEENYILTRNDSIIKVGSNVFFNDNK
jgi:hypothetical protein